MEFSVKDHLEICRCCLSENDLVDVLQVGNSNAPSVKDVFEYFNVLVSKSIHLYDFVGLYNVDSFT